MISLRGDPVGMLQRYLIGDEPEWSATLSAAGMSDLDSAVGMDYLIGETDALRRGVATAAIGLATEIDEDTDVIVSVQQANPGSWRALERCGFMRVWAGRLESDDPSDAGPAYVYRLSR